MSLLNSVALEACLSVVCVCVTAAMVTRLFSMFCLVSNSAIVLFISPKIDLVLTGIGSFIILELNHGFSVFYKMCIDSYGNFNGIQ